MNNFSSSPSFFFPLSSSSSSLSKRSRFILFFVIILFLMTIFSLFILFFGWVSHLQTSSTVELQATVEEDPSSSPVLHQNHHFNRKKAEIIHPNHYSNQKLNLYETLSQGIHKTYSPADSASSSSDPIEFVYQLPSSYPSKPIKGIVLLFHGCSHSAIDWWPKSNSCPNCLGLPIEMSIVYEALQRQMIPLAISSENRQHKCWSGSDEIRVSKVVVYFYQEIMKDSSYSIPLHALGASSGGHFVGILIQSTVLKPKLKSVCIQIAAIQPANHDDIETALLFIPMEKDLNTLRRIERIHSKFTSSLVLKGKEQSITKDYFHQGSHGFITTEESEKIYEAFVENQIIDKITGFLIKDPRGSSWRSVIQKYVPSVLQKDSLIADASPISELMNYAFSYHEITNEFNLQTFDWFLSHSNRVITG